MSTRLDKHEKISLAYSGGKDSLACVYLLKDYLDRITVYHVDAGDELPELREAVAHVEAMAPHFVRVTTDVKGWIAANGLPSDLVPYSAHILGHAMGEGRTRLVPRYDCCHANRAGPLLARIKDDGNTMMITGVRLDDMASMPAHDGDMVDGMEIFYPLYKWTAKDVLAYLAHVGAPLPAFYPELPHGLDCGGCSAWWNDQRAPYLRRKHPELYQQYHERMQLIAAELAEPVKLLAQEIRPHG
jgi:3'-phosphoadenosine 5'-phosphosulfate sulfotransferase (PAPS reductase)/FAD synthetase